MDNHKLTPEDLSTLILSVENKIGEKLTHAVMEIFKNTCLPSHDISHHRRVWEYTKKILVGISKTGIEFKPAFIESLMIAVFFHDTGLTESFDSKHGEISSFLALKFLKDNPLSTQLYHKELINAIVMHDDKTYSSSTKGSLKADIYRILTLADDLDALGALGLYRYFEIYFIRKIPAEKILASIITNIKSRFQFISNNLLFDEELLKNSEARYSIALSYLNQLNTSDICFLNYAFKERPKEYNDILNYPGINSNIRNLIQSAINEEHLILS